MGHRSYRLGLVSYWHVMIPCRCRYAAGNPCVFRLFLGHGYLTWQSYAAHVPAAAYHRVCFIVGRTWVLIAEQILELGCGQVGLCRAVGCFQDTNVLAGQIIAMQMGLVFLRR